MVSLKNKALNKSIEKLLSWSSEYHQQLPWRKKRSLYGTLVSEIMLQQTTVGTVLNHFEKFMKRFPTIQELAKASHEDLAIEWKGLGYYRRAKNLKNCAEEVTENYKGVIPKEREKLMQIKGIGDYTADALIAIGNNQRALAIDANLERVIARIYAIPEVKGLKLQKKIRQDFSEGKIFNLDKFSSWRELNEALMDLGRVYCKAKSVFCERCPMGDVCMSKAQGSMLKYPQVIVGNTKKENFDLKLLRVVFRKKGMLCVYQKAHNEWLSDQWEVPTLVISSEDKAFKQYPWVSSKKKIDLKKLKSIKTTITKYKITNYLYEIDGENVLEELGFKKNISYHKLNSSSNFSTATFKLLNILENKK